MLCERRAIFFNVRIGKAEAKIRKGLPGIEGHLSHKTVSVKCLTCGLVSGILFSLIEKTIERGSPDTEEFRRLQLVPAGPGEGVLHYLPGQLPATSWCPLLRSSECGLRWSARTASIGRFGPAGAKVDGISNFQRQVISRYPLVLAAYRGELK